ncbi:dynein light chain roadblock-type 2-like [Dunckerocampus dactyliophorus]|uniref:dynein light chain roadblock-type 2-like n=1 Tax=Dunckerocampus dactyliophorus TaxID=161453 RepID=UPI0024054A29|nr:dynein light chain roadblock-type 2-like [Dunckerocampus dactyliophorus]
MSEVEETLQRIEAQGSVLGTIIVNADGIPIRSTFDISKAGKYVDLFRQLTVLARSTVRDMDPENELVVLRISTKSQEIMVGPENGYLLILIQRYERYSRA